MHTSESSNRAFPRAGFPTQFISGKLETNVWKESVTRRVGGGERIPDQRRLRDLGQKNTHPPPDSAKGG